MLRPLYDWTLRLAAHPYALWALAAVSFAESSVFPIPPDIMLIPMVLATRSRAFRIALVCTLASVAGGVAGYGIGAFLYDTVGRPIFELYGYADEFAAFQTWYNAWGAWIVAAGGLSPIPYKVTTIASGVTGLDFPLFLAVSLLTRGARFFAVAALLWWVGPPIQRFVERNLGWAASLFLVLLLGGFAALRYAL